MNMPFEYGRIRKVLVQKGLNTVIGMGGERLNLFQFRLEWHKSPMQTAETIKSLEALPWERLENPRLARTVDDTPTEVSSQMETRVHTPGQGHLRMRYVQIGRNQLGQGQFGVVHKVIDVDTGKLMAVKSIHRPTGMTNDAVWNRALYYTLKREVEVLSEINHPHIVDYIASQGWDGPKVEIFMGLMEGTLQSLIENGANTSEVVKLLFPQMLKALDCIAAKSIVHRDVKPENILYISQAGGHVQFQLGDFGLCNREVDARSFAGSKLYMAPEMFSKGVQTSKLDVWSLFVTLLWTLDIDGFRYRQFTSIDETHEAVLLAASKYPLSSIREMAVVNPDERASAAQMLIRRYNGEGLSTPHPRVLQSTPHPPAAPFQLVPDNPSQDSFGPRWVEPDHVV